MSDVVSDQWLADHLDDPHIVVVDGSFKLPGMSPTAFEDYRSRHIPGAVFFDVDLVSDRDSPLPHMLPTADDFADHVGRMGISNEDFVIVYDGSGLMSAGRIWWTFKAFGHERVAVLNGGFKNWIANGRAVSDVVPTPPRKTFVASLDSSKVRTKDEVLRCLTTRDAEIVDARSRPRFEGREPEPRPSLRSGHIPGSFNLPFDLLSDKETGLLKSPDEIRHLFTEAKVDLDNPVVTTCGSGVTAAALAFGLHLIGKDDVAVYDGAWAEWGAPGDTPVQTA